MTDAERLVAEHTGRADYVTCPVCKAEPGEPCFIGGNFIRPFPHPERITGTSTKDGNK